MPLCFLFCRTKALYSLAVSFPPYPQAVSSLPSWTTDSLRLLASRLSPPPTYNLHAAARVRSLERLLNAHQRIPVVLTLRPTPLDQARHNLRSCSLSGLTSSSLFLTHSALQPLASFCSLNTKLRPALGPLADPAPSGVISNPSFSVKSH